MRAIDRDPSLTRTFIKARGNTAIQTPNTWPHPTSRRSSQPPLSRGSHPYTVRENRRRRGLGYEGGYDAVRPFAKGWSQNRSVVTAESYVPLYYAPG